MCQYEMSTCTRGWTVISITGEVRGPQVLGWGGGRKRYVIRCPHEVIVKTWHFIRKYSDIQVPEMFVYVETQTCMRSLEIFAE